MDAKLCECGCGQPTEIIQANNTARGDVKGQYRRFIRGHQNRGRKQTPEAINARRAGLLGHPVFEETKRRISEHHKAAGIKPPAEYAFKPGVSLGRREANANWKGGMSFVNGYRCLYQPDHSRAHPNGYVYEHILVLERKLGRPLEPGEVCHHIDGDKLNNDPANLEALSSQSEHIHLHRQQGDLF